MINLACCTYSQTFTKKAVTESNEWVIAAYPKWGWSHLLRWKNIMENNSPGT